MTFLQADLTVGGEGEGGVRGDLQLGGGGQARGGAVGQGGQAQPGPGQHKGLGPGRPGDREKDYGEQRE